ncbi:MAG: dipicolinate synthase subunit DpsA [Clostridia bacterium]|nr:dipicolinate synthase subunit DpsA [Clostridia bacterium]
MDNNFLVIGGDSRIVKLVNMLANKSVIYTYGLEKAEEIENNVNIIKCNRIDEEIVHKNNVIIGPTPFSKDGISIYAPYSENIINIKDTLKKCKEKHLIAGSIKDDLQKVADENSVQTTDLIKNEKLAILNSISTAEGAIEVAMKETDTIIHGSIILILGFGRIGKVLAKKLQGLSANVTCAARKQEDLAWINAYGYNSININTMEKELEQFDIIFNTVPHLILTKEKIRYLSKRCVLIELASRPGGIDSKEAEKYKIKVVEALALPGKVAPTTTAEFMKEAIYDLI